MLVNLSNYNTIIFDFGGVIFDIDPGRTELALSRLANNTALQQFKKSTAPDMFEMGKITATEFYNKFCQITQTQVGYNVFIRAWNAMLIDYKPKRIERLRLLAKTHKLIMLSNTNELHYAHFSEKLQSMYSVTFEQLFSSVYLSYKMGLLKPQRQIFATVLVEQNLMPEKTLFIEDTRENADAAKKLGIDTLVIPRNGNFYDYFDNIL